MALFKVCRGNESNLPTAKNDGWAYFCTNTGNFYIDWADSSNNLVRVQINAGCAERVRYLDGEEYVEIAAVEIAEALAKAHTHANKTVLDGVNAELVMMWSQTSAYVESLVSALMNNLMIAALSTRADETIYTRDGNEITAINKL